MNKDQIMKEIEAGRFEVYGLRMDEAEYEAGDICENSHDWWQDDPEDGSEYNADLGLWMGEELDGTCSVMVTADSIESALNRVRAYNPGGRLYLIGGYDWEEGNDIDEVIVRNARVLMAA